MTTFHINQFDVLFTWDTGDRSVGIWPGWEECCVSWRTDSGRFETVIGFEPGDNDATEWNVSYYSVDRFTDTGRREFGTIFDQDHRQGYKFGGFRTDAVEAVRRAWDYLAWQNYLEGLGESHWGAAQELDEMLWNAEQVGTAYDNAKALELQNEIDDAKFWTRWVQECFSHHFGDIEID